MTEEEITQMIAAQYEEHGGGKLLNAIALGFFRAAHRQDCLDDTAISLNCVAHVIDRIHERAWFVD